MPNSNRFDRDSVSQSVEEITLRNSHYFKSNRELNLFVLSVLDLTTLEGSDNNATIENLCNKAKSFASLKLPNVTAVCVYPVFVRQAKTLLKGTDIKVASVAGAFPSGQSPLEVKIAEIRYAIEQGADEIDMVISRGKFLQGDYLEVFDEIHSIKQVCKKVHLKVILETGEINDLNLIYDASVLALKAGADFIKTSTGKIPVAATPEAAFVMLHAIKDYYQKTGIKAGFKPAGGISTPEQARIYIRLVEEILGDKWFKNDLFRIGASRLATNLLTTLNS